MRLYKNGDSTPHEFFNALGKTGSAAGEGFWGMTYPSVVKWQGRDLIQITCVDITEHKKLENELRLRSKEYGALVRQSATGVMRYDLITDTAEVNVDRNLDRVEEYIIPNYISVVRSSGLIAASSVEMAKSVLEDMRNGLPSKGYDLHLSLERDGLRWIHVDYIIVDDSDGKPSRAVVSFYDNTEQHDREMAYQLWNARLNDLAGVYTAFMEVNLTKDIIEADGQFGSWNAVADQRHFSDFIDAMANDSVYGEDVFEYRNFFNRERLLGQFYAGTHEATFEYRYMLHGKYQWFRVEIQMVIAPFGSDVKASLLFNNIDADMRERERLTRVAERDIMTGLYNHAAAENHIKEILMQSTGERCCFLMIDLDDLRTINSDLGHPEGDRALCGIANAIKSTFGEEHILGRIGGDEFVVFLTNAPEEGLIRSWVNAFMHSVSDLRVGSKNNTPVHASVGGAVGIVGETDFKTLYEQADLALYYTKAMGKNDFNIYEPELEKRNFVYRPTSSVTLTQMELDWYESKEFKKLLKAMSSFFPLVISANLTKNSFYMMEYMTYASQRADDDGSFDKLIADGASAFHPEDRDGFLACFARENLLKAHAEGKKIVNHMGRQLGDDGVYRIVQTIAIFIEDEGSNDVCEISFTHVHGEVHEEQYSN